MRIPFYRGTQAPLRTHLSVTMSPPPKRRPEIDLKTETSNAAEAAFEAVITPSSVSDSVVGISFSNALSQSCHRFGNSRFEVPNDNLDIWRSLGQISKHHLATEGLNSIVWPSFENVPLQNA